MLSRRSIFSLFAGTAAIAAGARVGASPAPLKAEPGIEAIVPESQKFEIMTGEGVPVYELHKINDPTHAHTCTPVNMRSDGTLRHRQHHPVDFPARR